MCAWVFDESASKFGVECAPYRGEAVVGNKYGRHAQDSDKRHIQTYLSGSQY